jgi:hypothetical protein
MRAQSFDAFMAQLGPEIFGLTLKTAPQQTKDWDFSTNYRNFFKN